MYLLIYLCGFKKVTFVFVSLTAVVIVAEQIFPPLKDEFPPLLNIKMRFTTFLRHLIAKVSHTSHLYQNNHDMMHLLTPDPDSLPSGFSQNLHRN